MVLQNKKIKVSQNRTQESQRRWKETAGTAWRGLKELLQLFFRQCFLPSLVCCMFVELCSRRSFSGLFFYLLRNPFVFLYNTLIIAATASICLFVRRRVFVLGVVLFLWAAVGVADLVLLTFRTTPFTAVDFLMIKNALRIMNRYLNVLQFVGIVAGLCAVIAICVFLWKFGKKAEEKINYLVRIPFCGAMVAFCLLLTQAGLALKLLDRNFGNLANAFHDNGLPYCFMNSLINTGISKPNSYSQETVRLIINELEKGGEQKLPGSLALNGGSDVDKLAGGISGVSGEGMNKNLSGKQDMSDLLESASGVETGGITAGEQDAAVETVKNPNIIFLQLESFFDPNYVMDTVFTENPVPFFTYLKENFSSGFLSVPSVGAGTANTEFEVITGMNLDFFGPGEYPYKTVLLSRTCESMAYDFKQLGYSASAVHNNDGTFYGRNEVFANLGFDRFDSVEYMSEVEMTPLNWPKDKILIGEIQKILEMTKERDYIYAISVQGHGAYPSEPVLGAPSVDVRMSEELAEKYYEFLYYINQLREMDDFLRELTMVLEAYPEKVALVLYGDHLPGIGLSEDVLKNGSLYQTEYVIWSNFELADEKKDVEAYQLSAYVAGRLGLHEGTLVKYHQKNEDAWAESESEENVSEMNEQELAAQKPTVQESTGQGSTAQKPTAQESMAQKPTAQGPTAQESAAKQPTMQGTEAQEKPSQESTIRKPEKPKETEHFLAHQEYLEKLQILMYDMLYGSREVYGGENPYEPTRLFMGITPITVSQALLRTTTAKVAKPVLYVKGEGFTEWSVLAIDGKPVETVFLSGQLLATTDLPNLDGAEPFTVTVRQQGADQIILSETEPVAAEIP